MFFSPLINHHAQFAYFFLLARTAFTLRASRLVNIPQSPLAYAQRLQRKWIISTAHGGTFLNYIADI